MKQFISPNQLEQDCWHFAKKIFSSGQDFDLFVGVTRGGAQISIYMQEVFSLLSGKEKAYTTIGAKSYTGVYEAGDVEISGLDGVVSLGKDHPRVLIIDDIFDRGKTLLAVKTELLKVLTDHQLECTLRFAALYYKPENCIVDMKPDFYFETFPSDQWVVLPHELGNLSKEELAQKGFVF